MSGPYETAQALIDARNQIMEQMRALGGEDGNN